MHGSQYVTNQFCRSQYMTSIINQRRLLAANQLQSSSVHHNDEDQEDAWSQNPMVHKHNNFFTRMINQGKTVSSVTICLNKLCSTLMQLVNTLTALKIILLYVQGCEKRKLKHINTDWSQNRIENLFFINLNKYLIYRAAIKPRG